MTDDRTTTLEQATLALQGSGIQIVATRDGRYSVLNRQCMHVDTVAELADAVALARRLRDSVANEAAALDMLRAYTGAEGQKVTWQDRSPGTNITPEHQEAFNALRDPAYVNFALFSCFVNGKPTSAIVTINRQDDGDYHIAPVFVAITPGMKLVDHDGESP